jgi:hypothetical protein
MSDETDAVDRAFYKLTVLQRDAAWRECEALRARAEQAEAQRDQAVAHLTAVLYEYDDARNWLEAGDGTG